MANKDEKKNPTTTKNSEMQPIEEGEKLFDIDLDSLLHSAIDVDQSIVFGSALIEGGLAAREIERKAMIIGEILQKVRRQLRQLRNAET